MKRPCRRLLPSAALYDAGSTAIAVLLIFAGIAMLVASRPSPPPGRVVVVERDGPPGHSRIPPGQLKRVARVRVLTLTPAVATRYGVRYREGVLVVEVPGGSDSDGPSVLLRRLDIIVAVNGRPVKTEADLVVLAAQYRSRGWVEVIVVRSGQLLPLRVPVDALPAPTT